MMDVRDVQEDLGRPGDVILRFYGKHQRTQHCHH